MPPGRAWTTSSSRSTPALKARRARSNPPGVTGQRVGRPCIRGKTRGARLMRRAAGSTCGGRALRAPAAPDPRCRPPPDRPVQFDAPSSCGRAACGRPGLTGWAQVFSRKGASGSEARLVERTGTTPASWTVVSTNVAAIETVFLPPPYQGRTYRLLNDSYCVYGRRGC